ncbi:hypothetical protein MHN80_04455 [Gordonia McavH-238-E]|nr:hypothetical protein [Gordonia sp. LAM0048]MCG7631555.1 hypothetical protein [Gordonia sp. McavH-238-E]
MAAELAPLLAASLLHACSALNLLFVSAAWCIARPGYPVAAVLVGASVGWLLFNQPLEGRVLVSVTSEHGFTEADVLSVLGFAIALVTCARARALRRTG